MAGTGSVPPGSVPLGGGSQFWRLWSRWLCCGELAAVWFPFWPAVWVAAGELQFVRSSLLAALVILALVNPRALFGFVIPAIRIHFFLSWNLGRIVVVVEINPLDRVEA